MPKQRDIDVAPIRVGEVKNLEDPNVLRQMPANYLRAIEENTKLKDCCRDVKTNYTYETLKTKDSLESPDLAVFTCTVCGRKHYRAAVGPGQL